LDGSSILDYFPSKIQYGNLEVLHSDWCKFIDDYFTTNKPQNPSNPEEDISGFDEEDLKDL
jgi:hypothetical protein